MSDGTFHASDKSSQIRRFVFSCISFVVLQIAVFSGMEWIYEGIHFRGHYMRAYVDKKALLKNTPPPRLILVGGSSSAFGLNSPMIERAMGRPVINLGLHAGLGLGFMLRQAEAAVQSGDIVIVSPEYPLLESNQNEDVSLLLELITIDPSAMNYLPVDLAPHILDHFSEYVAKRPRALVLDAIFGPQPKDGIYSRSAFNKYGDVVAHRSRGTLYGLGLHAGLTVAPEDTHRKIQRLNVFGQRVRAAGGIPFLALPPIPEDDRMRQAERLAGLVTLLRAELDMTLLGSEVEGYPRSLFFDTAYHLTREGSKRRTHSLIQNLQSALKEKRSQR